jgi:hypothetical protein
MVVPPLPAVSLALLAALAAGPGSATAAAQDPAEPAARASHHTATGTMTAYDPETRQLTVHSATGSTLYHVASDARAWLGHHRLPISQIAAHVGAEVTLAWADVDGIPTTHTVRLEERRAAAK